MQNQHRGQYVFEGFTLDLDTAELRDGDEIVQVEPQVFDLIAFLAANAGRVVSRDEMIDHIWDGRIVSESAISTRINAARKALNDSGKHQRIIKTVHGKGFRFAADPRVISSNAGEVTTSETVSPPVSRNPMIAVLPFDNMSGDPEQEYFVDGITEDIITE